jgi:hydrogenase maturation protease
MERISILGMGNVLMGDDGAGPYVVTSLAARFRFPENVTLLDIGTPGLDLSPYLAAADTLLLVDTVQSEAPAGSIRTYNKQALLAQKPQIRLSPHDPAVGHCLATLEMAGCGPREMLLVGIVPERTTFGPGLSGAVRDAVPEAMARILGELAARGIAYEARAEAAEPDIWWEVVV